MTTEDIIIHIFCLVDEQLPPLPKHPQAKLYRERTGDCLGLSVALKGSHFRAFYRWLEAGLRRALCRLAGAH